MTSWARIRFETIPELEKQLDMESLKLKQVASYIQEQIVHSYAAGALILCSSHYFTVDF
jgi:hypothetical protein